MTRWPWLGLALCLLPVIAFAIGRYGSKRWADRIRSLTQRLEAVPMTGDTGPTHPQRFDSRELESLPPPVQRYFRRVLREGQAIVSAVTIDMTGTFNLSATGAQWKPFKSRQRVVTRRPGFLWDARVSMVPGLGVRVVDGYIAGAGLMRADILGLFTAATAGGEGEIARGEFMRFVAEAAWYPTALLPSQGVQWQAIDDHSASATLADGLLTLTLLFRFDGESLIESVRSEARGAMVGGKIVMMPWDCRLSGYELREGMTIPMSGEAAWLRPEGRKPYFHGRISSLAYEFAP